MTLYPRGYAAQAAGMRIHAFSTKNAIIAATSQKIKNLQSERVSRQLFFGACTCITAHCKLVHAEHF